MNIELRGRKAIVTGPTAGIGRAAVEGLACAGGEIKVLHPVNRRPRAWARASVLTDASRIHPVGEALSRIKLLTFDYLVNYYAAMGRISNAKEQLMAAATELTWQKGYNGVTVDDICERAGVRKGSFYYFFKSKAALSVAAMDNWWQTQTRPYLDSVFSASHPPLERIKAYFEMIHQYYLDQKNTGGRMLGCPFFSLAMEGGGLEPEVLHASQQYVKRKRKYLEAAIRDAQAEGVIKISSVEEAAQGLQALVEGAVALSRVQNDLEPLRSVYKEALRLLGATQPVAMA